jgi:hypothetical protein
MVYACHPSPFHRTLPSTANLFKYLRAVLTDTPTPSATSRAVAFPRPLLHQPEHPHQIPFQHPPLTFPRF